jgi:hypothetical protein
MGDMYTPRFLLFFLFVFFLPEVLLAVLLDEIDGFKLPLLDPCIHQAVILSKE